MYTKYIQNHYTLRHITCLNGNNKVKRVLRTCLCTFRAVLFFSHNYIHTFLFRPLKYLSPRNRAWEPDGRPPRFVGRDTDRMSGCCVPYGTNLKRETAEASDAAHQLEKVFMSPCMSVYVAFSYSTCPYIFELFSRDANSLEGTVRAFTILIKMPALFPKLLLCIIKSQVACQLDFGIFRRQVVNEPTTRGATEDFSNYYSR